MNNGTDEWTLAVIVGLTVVTVITRSLFFISSKPWHLPYWAHKSEKRMTFMRTPESRKKLSGL